MLLLEYLAYCTRIGSPDARASTLQPFRGQGFFLNLQQYRQNAEQVVVRIKLVVLCRQDKVLVVLWVPAEDPRYLSVINYVVMFLVNDLYGFVSWKRMEKRQL